MADIEKSDSVDEKGGVQEEVIIQYTGWRAFYYNPYTQVCMLGFVCFMCPGLFNALNGLGGGGQLNATTSANANAALYATFAFFAFFAGYELPHSVHCSLLTLYSSINNVLGPRITLFIGTMGYCLYIGSYLCANFHFIFTRF